MLPLLPRQGHYWAAQMNDVDRIREIAKLSPGLLADDGKPTPPPLNEWGVLPGLLAHIYDRLADVINAVVASAGGDPEKVRPFPRPVTAVDVLRKEHDEAEIDDLFASVRYANR